jgi:FkbM family methyltransferase
MTPLRKLYREFRNTLRIVGIGVALSWCQEIFRHRAEVLRAGNLQSADLAMASRPWLEIAAFGRSLKVPGECFGGAREMYGRQVYFAQPQMRISSGDLVVDLGANRGLFSLIALKMGAARAIAVEAQSGFIPLIRELLEKNGCLDRAVLECCMVGPNSGVLADSEAASRASHWGGKPPTRSLTELLSRHGFDRIDFLKMDIEGSEFDLLAMDAEALTKVRRIAMEVHPQFGDPEIIRRLLLDAGFTVALASADLRPISKFGAGAGYLYAFRS